MTDAAADTTFKSYTYSSGAQYQGMWLGTKRHGLGYWHHPGAQESYEGQYADNKQCGLGAYSFGPPSNKLYVGSWEGGEMHGDGIYYFTPTRTGPGASFYCGRYAHDKKDGDGFYMYDSQLLTRQQWRMGELTSEREATPGERVDCAARVRDLTMRVRRVAPKSLGPLPEPQSSRLFQFTNSTYTGQYHGQKKQGVGLWLSGGADGDCYEGCFDDNLMSGWGVYTSGKSGKCAVGQWEHGQMHGWLVYFFNAQQTECFVGTYCQDKKHGVGMYHYAETGSSRVQQWNMGELLSENDCDAASAAQWYEAIKKIVEYVLPFAPRFQCKCPLIARASSAASS